MSLVLIVAGLAGVIGLTALRLQIVLQPPRSPVRDGGTAHPTPRVVANRPVHPPGRPPGRRPGRRPGHPPGRAHRSVIGRMRSRHRPPSDDEIADWCESMARLLRSGSSLVTAVHTAPTGDRLAIALAPVQLATRRGGRLATALEGARGSSTALDRAITVIRICLEVGGHTAIALDRTAASLRDRTAVLAERRSQAAQARLSAMVLTLLPGGAVVVMALVSANLRDALLSPIGAVCLPMAAVLNTVGWWWMRTLSAARP